MSHPATHKPGVHCTELLLGEGGYPLLLRKRRVSIALSHPAARKPRVYIHVHRSAE